MDVVIITKVINFLEVQTTRKILTYIMIAEDGHLCIITLSK